MAKKFVMKSDVLHSGKKLEKGKLCPADLVSELQPKGLLSEAPGEPEAQDDESKKLDEKKKA